MSRFPWVPKPLPAATRSSLIDLGLAYYERAQRILQEVDAAEQMNTEHTATPRGVLRLSAPMTFGTMHLGPLIPAFMQRHPVVSVELELNDRTVDLIGEGYDMALRIGTLADSSLIARRGCSRSTSRAKCSRMARARMQYCLPARVRRR